MFDAVGRIEIYLRSRIAHLASEAELPILPLKNAGLSVTLTQP